MGMRTERVMRESPIVRDLFYGDKVTCNNTKQCTFQTYLLDNQANENIIDELISSKGIKLMISPTGAGKSYSILERAKAVTARNKDSKVIIALPSRPLALQMGNNSGVTVMIGGDGMDKESQIIATTYEKMFEVENYIFSQRVFNRKEKVYLVLDECHLLTTQHLFRETAIKGMIRCIEKKFFDSVLLVTATPFPMSLFHCNEIVEFESTNTTPAIDEIEIVVVDDPLEYIKGLDYSSEFPFIRLNNEKKIEELMGTMNQNMVKITSKDKNKKEYLDIVNDSKIDSTGTDGILCTSVLETGVSITDYPDSILPMAVFTDDHISADDIEQFLNRIRRTGNKHAKCARVVLRRPKERELKAALVTMENETVCEFDDVSMQMGDIYINDVSKMDAVKDRRYLLRIEIGGTVFYRELVVSSLGKTGANRYSKNDSKPLIYQNLGFRPFLNILKSNYRKADRLRDYLQELVVTLEEKRQRKKLFEKLDDAEMGLLEMNDAVLTEKMIKGTIEQMGELSECISYEKGEIVLDKRILYMISYNQFQRQYYFNHEFLKRELEERMNTKVAIRNENTAKGKSTPYNAEDIWENIEDLRQIILNNNSRSYWAAIMGESNLCTYFKKSREIICEIRKQEHLIELLKEMEKAGITGELALKILTSSKSRKKVRKYEKLHRMIITNQFLNKFTGDNPKEICFYNKNKEEKIQTAIYCYLEQKCQASYKITNELAEDIISFYKSIFPLSIKLPTARLIKSRMKQMYRTKGKDTIRKQPRLKADEIFELEEADY